MKLEMLLLKSLFAAVMGLSVLFFTSMLTLHADPVRLAGPTTGPVATQVNPQSHTSTSLPTCPLPPDQVICFRAG
ncbi:hypothetical protein [Oleiagrimonas sp. C23AA]|uniref:hypothetical protein n=1 Tax=Oleiagrimonas sp. C23AA TaxID=2719047 RepID=UPI00141DD12E|nr:hypothetical protein [Oleiagrimonas sp. C23AA]NII10905.1 hypothetical protein [Oleiagrimonas sp. C23AA]